MEVARANGYLKCHTRRRCEVVSRHLVRTLTIPFRLARVKSKSWIRHRVLFLLPLRCISRRLCPRRDNSIYASPTKWVLSTRERRPTLSEASVLSCNTSSSSQRLCSSSNPRSIKWRSSTKSDSPQSDLSNWQTRADPWLRHAQRIFTTQILVAVSCNLTQMRVTDSRFQRRASTINSSSCRQCSTSRRRSYLLGQVDVCLASKRRHSEPIFWVVFTSSFTT